MSQSIHGHEVMEMMLEEGGHFTRASLREAIEARFGADARFHTCSASEMDAEALIATMQDPTPAAAELADWKRRYAGLPHGQWDGGASGDA